MNTSLKLCNKGISVHVKKGKNKRTWEKGKKTEVIIASHCDIDDNDRSTWPESGFYCMKV